MIIDMVNRLLLSGDIQKLIHAKQLKPKILRMRKVYLFFNSQLLITKHKATAITCTADELKVSERYVYMSIKVMEAKELELSEMEPADWSDFPESD
jgi:hypothetical protein